MFFLELISLDLKVKFNLIDIRFRKQTKYILKLYFQIERKIEIEEKSERHL